MSLPRAVASSLRCNLYRTPIANSCALAPARCPKLRASTPSTSFQRSISSTARRTADKPHAENEDAEFAPLDEELLEAVETTSSSAPPSASSPLPWYLQNRPAPTPQQAAIIPDLPPNPPPLLSTLLDYIANTAGLDHLRIFDLRNLDPPPALGPSLIMILATARSEKHLHVSADRFCRYLRRNHSLRANAAGLLGRNELKIKLRRKAKRMKMMANVGGAAEEQGNLDDGIRTGWICCTVGKIEAHPEDQSVNVGMGEGFVGFRNVQPGVNVVVQMFTEEKRGEIDLETLWGGVLRTYERQDKNADDALEALVEQVKEAEAEAETHTAHGEERGRPEQVTQRAPEPEVKAPSSLHQFGKPRSSPGDVFPPASNSKSFQQMRRFHGV